MKTQFDLILDEVNTTVEYNPEWANGTGYFDGATTDDSITEEVKFVDDKGRRGLIVPILAIGQNVVFFDRYSDAQHGVVVLNTPYELTLPKLQGNVSEIVALAAVAIHTINEQPALGALAKKDVSLAVELTMEVSSNTGRAGDKPVVDLALRKPILDKVFEAGLVHYAVESFGKAKGSIEPANDGYYYITTPEKRSKYTPACGDTVGVEFGDDLLNILLA